MADEWLLRTYLELGAMPSAVPCARLHARQLMREWGVAELAEMVELVVSEIVTNAVRASEGLTASRYAGQWIPGVPPVRLWLFSNRKAVLIQVWDGDHRMPVRQNAEDWDGEGGRGLMLVEAICADCGLYVPEEASGKVVWARLTI